jgi:hypothetical protein
MSGSGNERRLSPRHEFTLPLRLHTKGASNGLRFAGQSLNLSERGLCFTAERQLGLGSQIEVELTMPREITGHQSMDVECTARVVYVDPAEGGKGQTRFGACFESIEPVVPGYWG